jgi:predicted GH43/DUF377 family glycosyl hydrolase
MSEEINFSKIALENGGSVYPLIIPSKDLKGPSLTNPSIFVDNGKVLVNLRNINYTLYHSEKKRFENHWGPLVYIHPENDMHLRTWNILCEMNDDFTIKRYNHVDTSKLDQTPLWDFVGLEDARIVHWDGKLYLSGVRRDTTTNGEGRMELSEIEITDNSIQEISRYRIPIPGDGESYCEKNWMPILDLPFHYVKWTNGTEVVKYDMETGKCEKVVGKHWKDLQTYDMRGGSQVLTCGDHYLALIHETYLLRSPVDRKDAVYRHRFVLWDKDWNIVTVSKVFSFMTGHIEFAVGMAAHKDDFLITFGFQDNAAYLLRVPQQVVEDFINES